MRPDVALAVWLAVAAPALGALMEVRTLPVGYGESHVLRLQPPGEPARFILIDAGPAAGRPVLRRALKQWKIRGLDLAAFSHAHPNHWDGWDIRARRPRVREVYWNGGPSADGSFERLLASMETAGARISTVSARTPSLSFGGIMLDVVHPERVGGDLHDDNLTFLVTAGRCAFLFAGDLSPQAQDQAWPRVQAALAERGATLAWASWPHHGDTLSASWQEGFRQVPHLVISVGPNEWGLPRLEGLRELHPRIRRTDRDGAITFATDGEALWEAR